MQYRVCFLMLLMTVFIGNVLLAQQQASFKINFNPDEHALDKNDELALNQLVAATQNASYYEIKISAHTDSDADAAYNVKLSERRAASVKDYLLANQIKPKQIVSQALGEKKPEADNATTDGKALNRRVDITLNTYSFQSTGDLIRQVSPDYKQSFTIDANRQNTIAGKNGTLITIGANALVTKSGKPVKGKVEVVIQEFLRPADAAFNQLSTMSNGKLLESGGMFAIHAYADGEEVLLKKKETMSVSMPTINMKNGMNLFTAVRNRQGITEWQPTTVPFRPVMEGARVVFVKLDTRYLVSLMIDCGPRPAEAQYVYQLPALPERPQACPPKPEYRAPVYNQVFPWHKRLFVSKEVLQKKFAVIIAKRERAFERRMAAYHKEMARLEPLWVKYKNDSARFEHEELQKFRSWLETQEQMHAVLAAYGEKVHWNLALQDLINLSTGDNLTSTDIKARFIKSTGANSQHFFDAYEHSNAASICSKLKQKTMRELVTMYDKKQVTLNYSAYKNLRFIKTGQSRITYAQEKLNENPRLMQMLDIAASDLVKKQADARAFAESTVGNLYTTSLSAFGTFNCDRFNETPPERMVTLTMPVTEEARVAFYVPSINSITYGIRDEFGYFTSLPKGTDVKVIYISFTKETGPMLQVEQGKFTQNTTINPKPKPVTLKDIEKALAAI